MNSRETKSGRIVGLLASLAIHLLAAAAAVALGPGGSLRPFSAADLRNPLPESTDARSQSAAAGPYRSNPGHASGPRLESRAATGQASFEESPSQGATSSVVQSIAEFASGDHSEPGRWLNHLWQSTLFAVAVGLLTVVFRKNHARVRYWLWFSTSVKFLVPFSLLMTMGGRLPWESTAPMAPAGTVSFTLAQISQPFLESGSSGLVPALSAPRSAGWIGLAMLGVWACGCAVIVGLRCRQWRRIRRAVRMSTAVSIPSVVLPPSVLVRSAPGLLEPGVIGFWRPIILLPASIEDHLAPAQLDAVLAHELCHIRHRDNLTAAIHMVVEAVFWFHPLVWWIGARLVTERERACDEDVLRTFGDPRTYAAGILNVCKHYVNARLACVSGVSGSDLRKRIEAIMTDHRSEMLCGWRRLLLATAGVATILGPVAVGVLSPPPLRAQAPVPGAADAAFDVASIKPNKSGDLRVTLMPQPGGRITATNVTAAMLIRFAYDLPDFQISSGPDWLDRDRFDLSAKAEGDPPLDQKRMMLRRLLAERFQLTTRPETRVLPMYALVAARGDGKMGPQLRRADADCARADQPSANAPVGPSPSSGLPGCGYFGFAPGTDFSSGRGGLAFRGLTMAALAKRLVPMLRRPVNDQTGLAGAFDADFDFIAELPLPPPPPGVPSPFTTPFVSVFTVFPEQLGLKLESRRGPVEVLVIDRAARPVEN